MRCVNKNEFVFSFRVLCFVFVFEIILRLGVKVEDEGEEESGRLRGSIIGGRRIF